MAISTLLKQRSAAFFDGMALAIAVGRCWVNLAATVPGFRPIPENQTMLVGARDFDVNERRLLNASDVDLEDPGRIRKMGLSSALCANCAYQKLRLLLQGVLPAEVIMLHANTG